MNFKILIKPLLVLFVLLFSFSCDKGSIFSENYFSVKINQVSGEFEPYNVKVQNGAIVLAAKLVDNSRTESVVITVKGDRPGKYKQIFDYKTGVSVTSCGLSYKITQKGSKGEPGYFTSYEGEVEISDIDYSAEELSGSYTFLVKSFEKDSVINEVKGEFLNVDFQ
ncbi:MAG: hypothetical protein U9N85_07725 [Bacteroidota bacterium]|nr:hypothetical protein [Bacteroidota bacterium]